jgi:drug/metabolite transporter (DMT)-like permease
VGSIRRHRARFLYPLITVAFAVAFLHEHLTKVQAAGIALAIVAAILLSWEPESLGQEDDQAARNDE